MSDDDDDDDDNINNYKHNNSEVLENRAGAVHTHRDGAEHLDDALQQRLLLPRPRATGAASEGETPACSCGNKGHLRDQRPPGGGQGRAPGNPRRDGGRTRGGGGGTWLSETELEAYCAASLRARARTHTHTPSGRVREVARAKEGRPGPGLSPPAGAPRKAARKRWRKGRGQRAVGSEASERGAGLTGCSCSGSLAPPPAAAAAAKANPLKGTAEPGWIRGVQATVTVG